MVEVGAFAALHHYCVEMSSDSLKDLGVQKGVQTRKVWPHQPRLFQTHRPSFPAMCPYTSHGLGRHISKISLKGDQFGYLEHL